MILCDRELELALDQGRLGIDPRPTPAMMDSTTVDLRLADTLDQWGFEDPTGGMGQSSPCFCPGDPTFRFAVIEKKFTRSVPIGAGGFSLPPVHMSTPQTGPQHFILGWTHERIYLPHTSRLCARVEGKSSLGRMGLGVHVTAPTIHAGFGWNVNEQDVTKQGVRLRLEIWNVGPLPIKLTHLMRVCQLIVEEVREVPNAGYKGGFNSQGPRPPAATPAPK